jgi:hypothetical protein
MHNDSYTCLGDLVALAAFGCLGDLDVLGVLGALGALGALVAFNPRIVPAASVTISDATKVASRVMMEAKDVMDFMMVFRRKYKIMC